MNPYEPASALVLNAADAKCGNGLLEDYVQPGEKKGFPASFGGYNLVDYNLFYGNIRH